MRLLLLLTLSVLSLSAQQDLAKLNDEWAKATLAGDVKTLERLAADDLVYTHTNGKVDNKATLLASLREGSLKYLQFDTGETKVQQYGDVALLFSRPTLKLTGGGQGERTLTPRFLRVWVKRGGRWQMVAHQSTAEQR